MFHVSMPPAEMETFLCSRCDGFWEAVAGSVDRCREAYCPQCAQAQFEARTGWSPNLSVVPSTVAS